MKRLSIGLLVTLGIQNAALAMQAQPAMITLVSSDGEEFKIAEHVALRSPQIANLLGKGEFKGFESVESETNQIQLNLISASTLEVLIPLLSALDRLLSKNEAILIARKANQSQEKNEIYIPRHYQPYVNFSLRNADTEDLAALFQAADFLELPYVINAVAALIANCICGNNRFDQFLRLTISQRLQAVEEILAEWNINVNQNVILKHVTLCKSGIIEEYSIADYLADKGQPTLYENFHLNLYGEKLTSLFGIERLKNQDKIRFLWLGGNCFFDFALDLQHPDQPFARFTHVETLYLVTNRLVDLPENFFAGLGNVRSLDLRENQLTTVPAGIFAGHQNLIDLDLRGNPLSQETIDQILKDVPPDVIQYDY